MGILKISWDQSVSLMGNGKGPGIFRSTPIKCNCLANSGRNRVSSYLNGPSDSGCEPWYTLQMLIVNDSSPSHQAIAKRSAKITPIRALISYYLW